MVTVSWAIPVAITMSIAVAGLAWSSGAAWTAQALAISVTAIEFVATHALEVGRGAVPSQTAEVEASGAACRRGRPFAAGIGKNRGGERQCQCRKGVSCSECDHFLRLLANLVRIEHRVQSTECLLSPPGSLPILFAGTA
jgi:hypothetical protein